MITKEQAQRIKSYVENIIVYETQALHSRICFAKSADKIGAEFMKCVLELNEQNAEETGKLFLAYLDSLTEDTDAICTSLDVSDSFDGQIN